MRKNKQLNKRNCNHTKQQYAIWLRMDDEEMLVDALENQIFEEFLNTGDSKIVKTVAYDTDVVSKMYEINAVYWSLNRSLSDELEFLNTEGNASFWCFLTLDKKLHELCLFDIAYSVPTLEDYKGKITMSAKISINDDAYEQLTKLMNTNIENVATIFLRIFNQDALTNYLNRRGLISIKGIKLLPGADLNDIDVQIKRMHVRK